jgi:hypothetical protein
MSHEIETNQITGNREIAFVGDTPWHGLGQQLTKDAHIDVWRKEAGLDWLAKTAPVVFQPYPEHAYQEINNKVVIFRSDTHAPLGVVTDRYKIHQPNEVLDFLIRWCNLRVSRSRWLVQSKAVSASGLWLMSTKKRWFYMMMPCAVISCSVPHSDGSTARSGSSPA